jgi:hypothetical protein
MCDKVHETNIPKDKISEFTYKVMQRTPEGTLISCVMGEPIPLGSWKQAPKRNPVNYLSQENLVKMLKRKYLDPWHSSSSFEDHHNGRFASFKNYHDAKDCIIVKNFLGCKTVIVKCQIGGTVDRSSWLGLETFLSSSIKIIEVLPSF